MSLIIPADVQDRLNALLRTGQFASQEEILRAAIAALEAQNAEVAAIQAGIDDLENGRVRPFADFDAEFRSRNSICLVGNQSSGRVAYYRGD